MVPPYVVHSMEGRARLRHPALLEAAVSKAARACLAGEACVREVRPGAGSLLLLLAPDADVAGLCARLEAAVPDIRRPLAAGGPCAVSAFSGRAGGRQKILGLAPRKFEVRVLLGAAGLCLGGIAVGLERAHVAIGLAWSLLAARHVWVRRKAL